MLARAMATLATPRLILRPFVPGDFPAVVSALNNEDVARNLARVAFPYQLKDAENFHAFIRSTDERSLFCAVAMKDEPARLRGFISYEWNEAKADAELGYWYDHTMWGRGFATEAGHAIIAHAFEVNRHPLLVSGYHLDNPASGNVLRKLGFAERGTVSEFSQARNHDVATMKMQLGRDTWITHKMRDQNTRRI